MKRVQIEERLAAIAAEMETMAAAAEGSESGTFTAEQQATFDEIRTESNTLKTKLESVKKTEAARAEAASIRTDLTLPGGNPGQKKGSTVGAVRDGEADPKRGFANLGEYCVAVYNAGSNPSQSEKLMTQLAAGNGMSASISADGGVFVPPAFSKTIWDRVREKSNSLLQYCTQVPFDPGNESLTIPGVDETSRANGSRWGGIRGYWKNELGQLTESKPKVREITLQPQELYVFAFISDKLLRKAPGAASALLERAASDEIAFKVGDSIFRGDGVAKPKGITGHNATVLVAKETSQTAATINAANINKMWARCHAGYRTGAVWFINQDCEPALEELSAVVGTGGVPIYLPAGGITETPNARLKGRPVVPIEYASTLGTVGDITLVNLEYYAAAVLGMVDQAVSMHLKFDFAQSAFRWIFEVDGQPFWTAPLTPAQGTSTLSPCVQLATRA